MIQLMFFNRNGVVEVELSPLWAVQEANAVRDAKTRLASLAESWQELDTVTQAREFRLAVFDCVTVTLSDAPTGRLWTDALAKVSKTGKAALRELVAYRADVIENLPLLCADNYKQAIEELCRLILT